MVQNSQIRKLVQLDQTLRDGRNAKQIKMSTRDNCEEREIFHCIRSFAKNTSHGL